MIRNTDNSFGRSDLTGCTPNPVLDAEGGCSVTVAGLTVVYGRVPVLRNVDLAVASGESVAFMGPNGAGKSTLLKCLVGTIRPAGGCVRWFGGLAARRNIDCRRIGYVGQEAGVYAELTALENLVFAGRMYGVAAVHDRAVALLQDADLERHAHRPAGQFSQGMRQRLAIARSQVHDPWLLVLDEPSSALDAAGRDWLERLFDRWRHTGRTVLFASHDAVQSYKLADRVVHLEAGQIVACEQGYSSRSTLRRSA